MRGRKVGILAAAAVLACSALVARFVSNFAGGADPSGYLNSAQLLAQGRLSEPVRTVPGVAPSAYRLDAFIPLGMRAGRKPGTMVPTYPVGLPLHLAIASFVVGFLHAGTLVNTLAWIAAIVLVYRLARLMRLSRNWSALAAVSFAVFPVTVLQSERLMSDLPATAWCLLAIVFAIRSRKRLRYAVVSGVSLAVAILVRPTDALLAPAVALAIGANPAALGLAAAGAAPILGALGLYNFVLYGNALVTGYGEIGSLVSVAFVGHGLLHFGRWLGTFLGPPALVLLVGSVLFAVRGDKRQIVLLSWGAAFVGFYALYEQSLFGWWRLRFLLPALPAIIGSALLTARTLLDLAKARWVKHPAVWRAVAAVLTAVLIWDLGASAHWVVRQRVWEVGSADGIYPRCIAWAERQVPSNAAFLAMETSGAMYFYGHSPIVRYDHLDEASYTRFRASAAAAGVPVYALLFRIDRLEFERRWPGAWELIGSLGKASLWRPRAPFTDSHTR
jgi:hypothetical protein